MSALQSVAHFWRAIKRKKVLSGSGGALKCQFYYIWNDTVVIDMEHGGPRFSVATPKTSGAKDGRPPFQGICLYVNPV